MNLFDLMTKYEKLNDKFCCALSEGDIKKCDLIENKLEKIIYCITGTIKLKASTAGSLRYCFRFLI